jgi:2-dehydro-3-deoxyphosphogluconate aldolase/(4S)-4-hydroxy-2-oxoglutarate aldolase
LTIEQADRAIAAGAKFIVSPGFNEKIVKHCLEKGVPMVPGINNPTGIEAALELGLDTVKFFPAEASGGIEMIKAMAAPYTAVKFMPTGGINAKNICDYLAFDKIIACGGSWMVKKDLVAAGKFDEIRALTEEAVRLMLGFTLKHVGINCDGEGEAVSVSDSFDKLFGFTTKVGNSSVFAGTFVEAMKSQGRGVHGHIAIGTNSVARARHYLETVKGAKFIEESASYKGDKLNAIYLEGEVGGFAVHLVNNK